MNKRKLKQIIREEVKSLIKEMDGSEYEEIQKYLYQNADAPISDTEFGWNRKYIVLDKMGRTTFVFMKNDMYDEDAVASAKVENGDLWVSYGTDIRSIRPDMKYRGPEHLMNSLMKIVNRYE